MDPPASRGVKCRNAHTATPVCSPSGDALLFGTQPFHSGLYPFFDTDRIDPMMLDRYLTLANSLGRADTGPDALDSSPYRNSTVVVLWSGHGYRLGEKQSFPKFSLWEESTHFPLIIWDARNPELEGRPSDESVSLINYNPTLAEMAGLEKPARVDGESLVSLLQGPARKRTQRAIAIRGPGIYSNRTRAWRYIRNFDGSEEPYRHRAVP